MSSTPPWEKTAWRMHWKREEWACLELTELMYMHASCICTIALTLFVYWAINICSPFHQMYSQVKTIIVPFLGVPCKKKTRGRRGRASLGKIRGLGNAVWKTAVSSEITLVCLSDWSDLIQAIRCLFRRNLRSPKTVSWKAKFSSSSSSSSSLLHSQKQSVLIYSQ